MDVTVEPARCYDFSFSGNRLCTWPDDDIDIRLRIRISSLANCNNLTAFKADIRFINTRMIYDERIGDNRIHRTFRAARLALSHAIADHLASAEFYLFTVSGQIFFNFDEEFRIRKPDFVTRCRTKHVGISCS